MKEFPWQERYKVHLWLTKHSRELEKFIGEWVAVSVNGVIAHGKSLVEISKKPEVISEQEKNPITFTLVPTSKPRII